MSTTTYNTSSSSRGLGFTGALTILFIALKLLGKIAWSWWWVLSPILISTGIALAILLGLLVWAVIRP